MTQVWRPSPPDTYLNLSNGRVRIEYTKGQQVPILFVHGLSYPMEVWSPLIDCAQQNGHSTICYDLYGRGRSSYDGSQLTTQHLAQQSIEILDQLHISTPVHIVALSNSDLIALQVATAHPRRIRSVTLIAPSGYDERTMNPYLRWASATPVIRDIIGRQMQHRLYTRMNSHYRHLPPDSPEYIRAIYRFAKTTVYGNPFFRKAICSQLANQPLPSQLAHLVEDFLKTEVPVQLLHFEEEADSSSQGIAVFAELISKYPSLSLPGTHMGLLEHPSLVWTEIQMALHSPTNDNDPSKRQ